MLEIDPYWPESHLIREIVLELQRDGVVVIPTDTVYALVCDIGSPKAIQKLTKIKGKGKHKLFSIILGDLSEIGTYAGDLSSFAYRTLKRLLPGPYTFILEAGPVIPKLMRYKRRTIGIRVPDCPIAQAIAEQLGRPLVATTLGMDEDPFLSDPAKLEKEFGNLVSLVVDGGVIYSEPSSVVDLTGPIEILRVGQGDVSLFE